MKDSLQYIGISHQTSSVIQREEFHISEEEKDYLVNHICHYFSDIKGLFLLSTCNRTEIYFESTNISAVTIRDLFIKFKVKHNIQPYRKLFNYSNSTEKTINHLLQVSSGLESQVLGDAEIIHQIKKAYQFSMDHQLQGSLLERALQTIFKTHKRISNETNFRDGTTSVAYKSLKVIRDSFDKNLVKSRKILFVGAGDIVKQLFKYNAKFNFNNIYISNRSKEKAIDLAKKNSCNPYDWGSVLTNKFQNFDVIVSAVSNCHHIIKKLPNSSKKIILIDLAIPSNIDKELAQNENIIYYDLDSISNELEETKLKRLEAMGNVNQIINEEISLYLQWLKDAPLRQFLSEYKVVIINKVKNYFEDNAQQYNNQKVNTVTNQIMRKIMAEPEAKISFNKIESIIENQVCLLNEKQLVPDH